MRRDDGLGVGFALESVETVVMLWDEVGALVRGLLLEVGGRGSHCYCVGGAAVGRDWGLSG